MKQIIYLAQWLEKIIEHWQPHQLMMIEDDEKCISNLLLCLLKASHNPMKFVTEGWNEGKHEENNAEVSLLAFPPKTYSEEKLLQVIDYYLEKTTQVLYLIAPIKEDGVSSQRINPLMFKGYEMSLWRVVDEKINLQIYAFWPRVGSKRLETPNVRKPLPQHSKPLHIVYYLPHIQLTGGLKCLLEQIRQLTRCGHEVSIIRRVKEGETHFLPTWFDLKKGRDVKNTYGMSEKDDVRQFIPHDTDLVMVGWLSQLNEFYDYGGKICLWEQGSEWLFGDFGEEGLYSRNAHYYMKYIYTLPFPILSVSKVVQDLLKERYGKESEVLTCGIDTHFYYPLKEKKVAECPTILMLGSPYLPFKQLSWAHHLLQRLFEMKLTFKVVWITPVPVQGSEVPYSREIIVSPPQDQLAKYYREADLCLFTSLYEAFAMPPLEAMASGIPVVSTNCGGIMTYAKPNINAIICEVGDEEGMLNGLRDLLQNPRLRQIMGEKGRETALTFDYQIVGERLEQLLYTLCE